MKLIKSKYAQVPASEKSLLTSEDTNLTILLQQIKDAHQELEDARQLFGELSDPEMIDYLVFKLRAAEEKYWFLMKQARKLNLESDLIVP